MYKTKCVPVLKIWTPFVRGRVSAATQAWRGTLDPHSLSPCRARHWPEPSARRKSIIDGQGKWHQDLCHLRRRRGHQVCLRHNWYRWRCFVHLHGVPEVYHRPKRGLWNKNESVTQLASDAWERCPREASMYFIWSLPSLHRFAFWLYCDVKPLFIKKLFFVFTFASAFLICSLSCSSLSWNGLDRFPTASKSFSVKSEVVRQLQNSTPCAVPWAVLLYWATVAIMSPCHRLIPPIHKSHSLNIAKSKEHLPVQPVSVISGSVTRFVGYALQRSGMSGVTFKRC